VAIVTIVTVKLWRMRELKHGEVKRRKGLLLRKGVLCADDQQKSLLFALIDSKFGIIPDSKEDILWTDIRRVYLNGRDICIDVIAYSYDITIVREREGEEHIFRARTIMEATLWVHTIARIASKVQGSKLDPASISSVSNPDNPPSKPNKPQKYHGSVYSGDYTVKKPSPPTPPPRINSLVNIFNKPTEKEEKSHPRVPPRPKDSSSDYFQSLKMMYETSQNILAPAYTAVKAPPLPPRRYSDISTNVKPMKSKAPKRPPKPSTLSNSVNNKVL